MIIISRYSVNYDSSRGVYVIRNTEGIPACPACGSQLRPYGRRIRHVIDGSGTVRLYDLRRLRCDRCAVLHLEIPAELRPGKYYDAQTIEAAVSGDASDCPAEDSTIRRWRKSSRK